MSYSRFINCKTLDAFNAALESDKITDSSIVFIEESKQIYTHGQFYSCPYTKEEIKDLINSGKYELTKGKIEAVLTGNITSHTHNQYLTKETDPTVPSWAKASTKPKYTASEVGALPSGGTAVNASKVANSMTIKLNSGTTEGTNLYTFNGSSAKTLDVKAGSNVTFTAAAGSVTISSKDTTYGVASTSANGLMSKEDKTKLNGIESGAQVNDVTSVAGRTGAVTLTKSDVGLSNVTNESKATMFTNAALTGTPTAPTPSSSTNSTQIATTAFVQGLINSKIAASDAMIYKGTIGSTGATITALPDTTAKTGWTYKVLTAGTYASQKCEVGDMIICLTDGSSSTNATWNVIQTNIDGAVTGPGSSVDAHVATFNGSTGKVIKDSGFTIGKSVPSNAVFTDTHYTTNIYAGSGGSSNASTTNGNTKITVADNTTARRSVTIKGAGATSVTSDSTGVITINSTNTTYGVATGSSNGLMSSSDKTKLDGIESGAQVNDVTSVAGRTGAVTLTKSDVGLSNVTNESKATMFTNAALTGTPTAPTPSSSTNSTQIATTAFVQGLINSKIAASDAMIYKGTIGSTGATITALPDTTAKTGWTYKVLTAGTYASQKCEVGDMIICLTDGSSSTNATWNVIQTNIDGAVTGPGSSVDAHVATFNGSTGKVIKDSGFTIGKSVPSNAVFTDTHYTTNIYAGSGGSSNASTTNGNTKITVADNTTARRSVTIKGAGATSVTSDSTGVITINSTNTTYGVATGSSNGLMSSSDKTKLDGIATGANKTVVDASLSSSSTNPVQNKVINSALAGKMNVQPTMLTNQNLNDIKTPGVYAAGGGNSVTNKPEGIDAFGLTVYLGAGSVIIQEITAGNTLALSKYIRQYKYIPENTHEWDNWYICTSKFSSDPVANQVIVAADTIGNIRTSGFTIAKSVPADAKFTDTIYSLPTASSSVLGGVKVGSNITLSSGVISLTKANVTSALGYTPPTTNTNTTYTFANGNGSFTVTPSGGSAQTVSIGKPSTAGTADKAGSLSTARSIDGVNFNGSINITHYGTCSTEAGTAAKAVSLSNFTLTTGSRVVVKFTVTNTASNPTLNVNNTGAKAIYYRSAAISAGYLSANRTIEFVYNGTQYETIGDFDTNTTYGVASTSSNGLMSTAMVSKLNGIANNANNYSHPTTSGNKHIPAGGSSGQILRWSADGTAVWGNDNNTTYGQASSSTLGLVKIGFPESGKNYPVELNSSGQMFVNVPWTDNNTTYGLASTSANGLLKQLSGNTGQFMRGDGTWATPPNTTYGLVGGNGSTGLIKNGSTVTSASGYTACPIVGGIPYYKDTNTTYTLGSFGVTASAGELNHCKGVTSGIQSQLNGKASSGQTFYIGTTQVAINRGSAALTLSGVNISGSSGSCTGNAASATYVTRDRGSNTVSTLASLPVTKSLVKANLSSATNLSLAANMNEGESITIICNPTASFTQPLPNSGSWKSMDGSSLSVTSGKTFEINIYCYATNTYSISCKVQK